MRGPDVRRQCYRDLTAPPCSIRRVAASDALSARFADSFRFLQILVARARNDRGPRSSVGAIVLGVG